MRDSEASRVGDCWENLGRSWQLSVGVRTQAWLGGGDGKLNRLGLEDWSSWVLGEGKLDGRGLGTGSMDGRGPGEQAPQLGKLGGRGLGNRLHGSRFCCRLIYTPCASSTEI